MRGHQTQSLPSSTQTRGRRAYRIKRDMPVGGAASVVIHGGLLLTALFAWQMTPRIMPEDVISVDMVSDTQSVIGPTPSATPETAQQGVDTPTPSPLAQASEPIVNQETPAPVPAPVAAPLSATIPAPEAPTPAPAPTPKPTPAAPPAPAPAKMPAVAKTPVVAPDRAPPSPKSAPRPTPQPQPQPLPKPLPKPSPVANAPAPQATPKKQAVPAPARQGPRQAAPAAPPEFDLAAASNAATGADSGGRRSPQLAARGQAGRLGQAGGGTQLTGDLEAALRRQIQPCWLEPADMGNPKRLLVEVSIDLGIDGRLLRDPVLVTPSSRAGADASLVVAIDNALRAVRQCAPFSLPPDRYESWRQVRFSFDPRRMGRTP